MEGLELLGASDALANQYITIRIKSIDQAKLQQALGGSTGALAASGMTFVNMAPKAALDIVTPVVKNKIKDYGIDADIVIANAPPVKRARAMSEFFPGLLFGFGIGVSSLMLWKMLEAIFARRS